MSREPVRLTATPSQTVGPFFHHGLADNSLLGRLVRSDTKGERVTLTIRVLDGDGAPVPDALVEVWQADADGAYIRPDEPANALKPSAFCGFGRLPTGADGTCVFETIRPGRVPDGQGGLQAPHINLCVFARGLLRHLCTRMYFAGAEGLDRDIVLALVPEERRCTLVAQPAGAVGAGQWTFDIRLQGDGETVFFDL
jgi:protocatechuate 3,4-dioxygenase alpha subunit